MVEYQQGWVGSRVGEVRHSLRAHRAATPVPVLALGIMITPSLRQSRDAIRRTWFRHAAVVSGEALVRFVAGNVPCAMRALQDEANDHGDMVFVDSSDCQPWYAAAKVHAWYQYALLHFRGARWYGKMEDDGMLHAGALLAKLAALDVLTKLSRTIYYGNGAQWVAHCVTNWTSSSSSSSARSWAATTCAQGCWLGKVSSSIRGPDGSGRPPLCERAHDGQPVVVGSASCPQLPYAPFFPGPLEVRSPPLTRLVARCAYAAGYFSSLVARGELVADECASTDGAQGHAIGECIARSSGNLVLADDGEMASAYASKRTAGLLRTMLSERSKPFAHGRATRVSWRPPPLVLHPIKPHPGVAAVWDEFWPILNRSHDEVLAGGGTVLRGDDVVVVHVRWERGSLQQALPLARRARAQPSPGTPW